MPTPQTMRYFLYTALFLTLTASCAPARTTSTTEPPDRDSALARRAIDQSQGSNSVEVNTAETGNDLTNYLRKVAGVSVRGSGEEATIRIRGDVNFNADSTPLFVLNGTILGNNFSSVYSAVDVNEIARVRVLKNVSDTNRYGMQGANGVIEIKLR